MRKKVTEEALVFTPSENSWTVDAFARASLPQVKEKQVDCPTCPVSLSCMEGVHGTGYVCQTCRSTGVFIDTPETGKMPKDIYAVDCNKHKFHQNDKSKHMARCPMCSGEIVELHVNNIASKNHYISTVHSAVPIDQRHAFFKEELDRLEAERDSKTPEET